MPPANTRAEPLTVEDYRATSEGTRYQLVEGDLYLRSPAPNRYHQTIVLNVAEMLRGFLREKPIGEVYISPIDVYLSDNDVVQPDVAFVSSTRSDISRKMESTAHRISSSKYSHLTPHHSRKPSSASTPGTA